MIYVEAPQEFEVPPGAFSVFLAGGITGCPDCQSEICDKLKNKPDSLVIFNPRRKDFPIENPLVAEDQIPWEYKYLRKASLISFWFPKETLCPIVLFEYGAHTMTRKPIVVGAHPDYVRRQDLEIQTKLVRPVLPIFDNLDDVIEGIKYWYGQLRAY